MKDYGVMIDNGYKDWEDASTNADWYDTYDAALAAGMEAFADEEVDEVKVAVFEDGEIEDFPLTLRREDGSIHQYRGGERLWA